MSHIEMPIWNKCNNKCVMCTNRESMRNKYVFGYESVINYLNKQVRKNNSEYPQSISLTGGETTICPYFFKLNSYIRERFPQSRISILTNGRMLAYDNFRKNCINLKKTDFIIPLHAHEAKLHDRITQIEGSFSQTLEGLKKFLSERSFDQQLEIRIIITRLNFMILPQILELIETDLKRPERVVLVFQEFEGEAELNKDSIGVTYGQLRPVFDQIKVFLGRLNLRLYHFPLCVLEPIFWPYAWRTLPKEEITFLPACRKCVIRKYCLGIHKSYLTFNRKPEIRPYLSLKGIKITEGADTYKPIQSVQIDRAAQQLNALGALTDDLMSAKTEPTKYFFSSLFFKLNNLKSYNAEEVRQWWLQALNGKSRVKGRLVNLYVHLPFCKSRCTFCRHPAIVSEGKIVEDYLNKIADEMSFYKDAFSGKELNNIYIGGGTPSILSEKQITFLLSKLLRNFSFTDSGQRNFECDPKSITLGKLKVLKEFGFNRVSLGVQSLDREVLRSANRSYQTYASVKNSILNAKECGLDVNVDLMIGLYKESAASINKTLKKIMELGPSNISLYPLKPTFTYLKRFFRGSEEFFHSQLEKRAAAVIEASKATARRFDYSYPEGIYLSEGCCVNFSKKGLKEKRFASEYYEEELLYSTFGIGSFSVSKVAGIGRYNNFSPIESKFSPLFRCYQGAPCQLKDDMRDYLLEHFAKGRPVSKSAVKRLFGGDLIKNFAHAFLALKELNKIRVVGDLVYFLPKNLQEMFIYGFFFWDEAELKRLQENIIAQKNTSAFNRNPKTRPHLSLDAIRIKERGGVCDPIKSLQSDTAEDHLDWLNSFTDRLMSQGSEPTKYFFSSIFFKINEHKSYGAEDIRAYWTKAVKEIKDGKRNQLLNFYIHIPFCNSKCSYCMYPSIIPAKEEEISNYLKRIKKELSFYKDTFKGIKFTNIYIGGGSPSKLNERQLTFLLSSLAKNFNFSESGERNFECNPSTITLNKLKIIRRFNFNRISLGVQSLDKKVLRWANRGYQDYKAVREAISNAKMLGFKVNVDLMIGLYKDTPETLAQTFQNIFKLKPDSVSLYPLKPPSKYLETSHKVKEAVFYANLNDNVARFLKHIKPIAEKSNYSCPDSILLSEGYCVTFKNRANIFADDMTKLAYYNEALPSSIFGIGYSSVSKITGLLRYKNELSIQGEFFPSEFCYRGHPADLKDDMRDYVLDHFSKGFPLSRMTFKKAFGQELLESFPYAFSVLEKHKKVKIGKDSVCFLPKGLKDLFMYGLLFWDKQDILEIERGTCK